MKDLLLKFKTWNNERPERLVLYSSLVGIVIPIALQNLLGCLVNSADIFMLGYVGQDELAAVSLANQYMFILWGFFFGVNSATTILNSQYWGKGNMKAIQVVCGIAFKLSFLITGVISLACIFLPYQLMTIYTNDAALVSIGANYLRVVGISYIFLSFSQAYSCTLRSSGHATKSTVISTITIIINVFLNAAFIFGLFGFPKLGLLGVAIATTFARAVELLICIVDYAKGTIFKPEIKLLLGTHKELRNDFIKYAAPALANDLIWTFAFSTYSIILGHISNDMVAASSVATTLRDLFATMCFGLGSGGTVLIGKELGANNLEKAKKDSATLCHMTIIITALFGLLLVIVRHPLMNLFSLNATAYNYLDKMVLISSYYIIGQAINTLCIAGIFRAGGNSKFGMYCDLIFMWVIAVPVGFLSAFVFKFPPMVVYFILCLDEFYKIPVVYKYYKSYKWLNNITKDNIFD